MRKRNPPPYWVEKRNPPGIGDIIEKGGRFIENTVNAFITDVCSLDYANNHYNNVRNIVHENHNIRERMEIQRRNAYHINDNDDLIDIQDRIDRQMAMRQHRQSKLFDAGHFDPHAVIPFTEPAPQQLSASNIAQTRSVIHGDMKNNQIVYINMLGKDISVLVKRKSGNKELEFFKGGDAVLNDLKSDPPPDEIKRRQYVSEFGMKVSLSGSHKKPNIIDILTNANSADVLNTDAKIIAFIIPNGTYEKINWDIPENGKKIWIFSPGNEIAGGDAICGHELYDSFISWNAI